MGNTRERRTLRIIKYLVKTPNWEFLLFGPKADFWNSSHRGLWVKDPTRTLKIIPKSPYENNKTDKEDN